MSPAVEFPGTPSFPDFGKGGEAARPAKTNLPLSAPPSATKAQRQFTLSDVAKGGAAEISPGRKPGEP